MKLSEAWLREWVNPSLTREQIGEALTMAGLEVEGIHPAAEKFHGVVVAKVEKVEKHPDADNLQICQVDVKARKLLNIVCGASNVRAGMKVAAALIGSTLPNKEPLKQTTIRGVISEGMLCSTSDLGMSETSDGLFELPQDAIVGKDLWEYLNLGDDYLFEISITPNRGDCLSTKGIAREISAITTATLTLPKIKDIPATIPDELTITLDAVNECPHYIGRIIKDVNNNTPTPIKYRERLRQAGIRSISLVVDIMNYVMLELGQPMHAFSLDKISKNIHVRIAKENEKILLLDDREVTLTSQTLIIADDEKPLAIAGVMGGLDSAVALETKDIFLESAYFTPQTIAKTCRAYTINSDSAYRFERNVDITIQRTAIERATQLIIEIAGGEAGKIIDVTDKAPGPIEITLRKNRIKQILGCDIPDSTVENILGRLGFAKVNTQAGWQVTVPQRRADISIEVDLIEEIARLHGYDKIPLTKTHATLDIHPVTEKKISDRKIRNLFADLGYHEVVTYSFVDKAQQALFSNEKILQELLNPISAEMSVMRTTLMPGLLNVLLYNQNRQQPRVRIFEMGLRFVMENEKLAQKKTLAGLISGDKIPQQWGSPKKSVDFYDLKGDLCNLFDLSFSGADFEFLPGKHVALHPGQTAIIMFKDNPIGVIGALHPQIVDKFKIDEKVFIYELDYDQLDRAILPKYKAISKFPEIRRDIAIIINHAIPSKDISDTIKEVAKELLKDLDIFDVYQGKGIAPEQKSIALSLTLQHASRTLVDEEVVKLMDRVIVALKERFNAELRG